MGAWVDTREGINEEWFALTDQIDAAPGVALAEYLSVIGFAMSKIDAWKASKAM